MMERAAVTECEILDDPIDAKEIELLQRCEIPDEDDEAFDVDAEEE